MKELIITVINEQDTPPVFKQMPHLVQLTEESGPVSSSSSSFHLLVKDFYDYNFSNYYNLNNSILCVKKFCSKMTHFVLIKKSNLELSKLKVLNDSEFHHDELIFILFFH